MKTSRSEFLSGAVATALLPWAAEDEHRWWDETSREFAEGRAGVGDGHRRFESLPDYRWNG
ncbi:MAG: hypothetical protein MJ249_09500 [Kiritimatiellae bacterium]|nr:hypothetical protein [Kiritimatiellia bacterium]